MAVKPERLRLFYALWPPAPVAESLARWGRAVAQDCGGRALAPEAIHLTLAFLGWLPPERLGAARAAGAAARGEVHALVLDRVRYQARSGIVWAECSQPPAALAALAASLTACLSGSGFGLEARPFAPHVTLVRRARPAAELAPLPPTDWPVQEFALVRSRLGSERAVYETLERFPLRLAR